MTTSKRFSSMICIFLMVFSLTATGVAFAGNGNSNGNGNGGNGNANDQACWGQATRVFAQTGAMGYHASNQDEPRLGLRNLAVVLFDAGLIDAPTLQALGAFVSEDISACQ